MSLTLVPPRPLRAFSIAVTSGKGGVGKTSVAIHLAGALANLRRRVALVDADFALGNIDVRLGLTPTEHLGGVLAGECDVDAITMTGPLGIDVVPAASGVRELSHLEPIQWRRLARALSDLAEDRDFLVIDTASGVSDAVLDVIGLADYALVVASDEPAALVDAYATIKLVTEADRTKPIGVVVNAIRDADDAERVYSQLSRASRRFLQRPLRDDGYIVDDPSVCAAPPASARLGDDLAASPAGRCFRRLAARLAAAAVVPPDPGPAPALVRLDAPALVEAPRCA
jgi:flagellar biosynthesis protein FlhG